MNIENKTYKRDLNNQVNILDDNEVVLPKTISENFKRYFISEDYENYIAEYSGNIVNTIEKLDYAAVSVVGPIFALITVKKGRLEELLNNVSEITYIEKSYPYTLTGLEKMNSTTSYNFMSGNNESLNGEGVIIGIIGTGIDYLNPRLQNVDGTTRVVAVWDQTIDDVINEPSIFNSKEVYGKEYYKEDINKAINASLEGKDPYTIVSHKDELGFTTAIAGIAGGRKLSKEDNFISVAPKCEFAVVKLREAKRNTLQLIGIDSTDEPVYESANIRGALLYLAEVQVKERKPMVIFLPLGSNVGGHDGASPIERYIDYFSERKGLEIVTDSGMQGNSDTHTSGQIVKTGGTATIEVEVGEKQKNLFMSIWFSRPDKVSIGITPPTGNSIKKIPALLFNGENIEIKINESRAIIQYFLSYTNGVEYILLLIKNVTRGTWKIDLYGDFITVGRYDAWLLQRELLEPETRFIKPDPLITLTLPSSGEMNFTTSYFDNSTELPSVNSGKGFTRDGRIQPGLCIGGTNILTTGVNKEDIIVGGSAVAGAIISGAVALTLQWGFLQGNDKNLYTAKIKTYFLRSLTKVPSETYPNEQCGFGRFSFELLFKNLQVRKKCVSESYYCECLEKSNNLFVRIPRNMP